MARPKKVDSNQLIAILDNYFTNVIEGDVTKLKYSNLEAYFKTCGVDVAAYNLRRDKDFVNALERLKTSDNLCGQIIEDVRYKTLDIEQLIKSCYDLKSFRKALLELDTALSNNNVESEVTVSDAIIPADDGLTGDGLTDDAGEETVEGEEDDATVEIPPQSNMPTYIIIGVLGVAAIGAWYYLKMVKGKKEDFLDEDDEEDDEEEVYESDDDDGSDGDDFFEMDDDETTPGSPVPMDMSEDVADTIDEE